MLPRLVANIARTRYSVVSIGLWRKRGI